MSHLHLHFNEADRAALCAFLEKQKNIMQSQLTVNQFVEKWRTFVRSVEREYSESIYEYTNDLSVRDVLQKIILILTENGKFELLQVIQPIDNAFIDATIKVDASIIHGKGNDSWWWFRVPKNTNEDLREYFNDIRP